MDQSKSGAKRAMMRALMGRDRKQGMSGLSTRPSKGLELVRIDKRVETTSPFNRFVVHDHSGIEQRDVVSGHEHSLR